MPMSVQEQGKREMRSVRVKVETQVYTLSDMTKAKLIITAPLHPSEQILSL